MSPLSERNRRRRPTTSLAAAALLVVGWVATGACGDDASKHGGRALCGTGPDTLPGCQDDPLVTGEDVCWRLVDCGVIPVEAAEDSGIFDWAACVNRMDRIDEFQFDFAVACVSASTCDDLKVEGSPSSPRSVPLCLLHGDQ